VNVSAGKGVENCRKLGYEMPMLSGINNIGLSKLWWCAY